MAQEISKKHKRAFKKQQEEKTRNEDVVLVIKFKDGVSRRRALKILESFGFWRITDSWGYPPRTLTIACQRELSNLFMREIAEEEEVEAIKKVKIQKRREKMKQKCATCKIQEVTSGRRRVFVKNNECYLEVYTEERECYECTKMRVFGKLVCALRAGIVRIEKEKIVVNWDLFIDTNRYFEKYPLNHFNCLVELLLALNVLSFEIEGNFEVVSVQRRFALNPRLHERLLFFTRFSDIAQYVKLKLSDVTYDDWEVHKIEKAYNSKIILGEAK